MARPLPLKRKQAHDRLNAAVHEAGHVVVAQHVGVTVTRTYICPVPEARDSYLTRKTWKGDTVVAGFDNPSPEQLTKAGVAGAIAELRWRGEPIEKWKSLMSDSDWAICGCRPGQITSELEDAALVVYALLNRENQTLWQRLCRQARDLIKESRTPVK